MNRWYVRCVRCLSVGAIDETPQAGWTCGCCGGRIEVMGRVRLDGKRLEKEVEVSACDARCTHARGPLCVCKCACVNHGTGRVVRVVRDAGMVPTVQLEREEDNLLCAEEMDRTIARAKQQIELLQRAASWDQRRLGWRMQEQVRKLLLARTWKARKKGMGVLQEEDKNCPEMALQ